jgi:hypothetical protein
MDFWCTVQKVTQQGPCRSLSEDLNFIPNRVMNVVRFVCVIRVPLCARVCPCVSRVCPGSPGLF